jgi:class 3 adenylate cyclase
VNVAARVGAIAGAGELVLTGAVYDSPGVAELLAAYPEQHEHVPLKGVAEPVPVYRFGGALPAVALQGAAPAQVPKGGASAPRR